MKRRNFLGLMLAGLVAPWEGIRRALGPCPAKLPFVPMYWKHLPDDSTELRVFHGEVRYDTLELFERTTGLRDLMYGVGPRTAQGDRTGRRTLMHGESRDA